VKVDKPPCITGAWLNGEAGRLAETDNPQSLKARVPVGHANQINLRMVAGIRRAATF
jgi:hypothetical protein